MSVIVVAVMILAPFIGAVLIALVAVSIGLCVSRSKLKLSPKREEVHSNNRPAHIIASKTLPVPPSIVEEYEDIENDYAEHVDSGYRNIAGGHHTIPTEVPKTEPTEREYLEFIEEDPAQWEVTSNISYVGPDEATQVCQET